MCGIVGLINLNGGVTKAQVDYFTGMLSRCEIRGTHAAGVVNDSLSVVKNAVPSSDLVKSPGYLEWCLASKGAKFLVGHCRLATRGAPSINSNNHPVVNDKDVDKALVHNGLINSDKFDKDRSVVDSMIPLWIIEGDKIESNADMIKSLKKIHENADVDGVIVLITKNILGFLRTDKRPLVFHSTKGGILFASTDLIMNAKSTHELGKNQVISFDKRNKKWLRDVIPVKVVPVVESTGWWSSYEEKFDTLTKNEFVEQVQELMEMGEITCKVCGEPVNFDKFIKGKKGKSPQIRYVCLQCQEVSTESLKDLGIDYPEHLKAKKVVNESLDKWWEEPVQVPKVQVQEFKRKKQKNTPKEKAKGVIESRKAIASLLPEFRRKDDSFKPKCENFIRADGFTTLGWCVHRSEYVDEGDGHNKKDSEHLYKCSWCTINGMRLK
jgi:uncharacterized membrane protein YwzB